MTRVLVVDDEPAILEVLKRGLAAEGTAVGVADARDLGADDHLVKPLSFVVLLAPMRALQLLANHPDEVMSKTEILRGVWDEHFEGDSNIEVYLGYLRRKIDAPYGRHAIGTVRGVGYRLRSDGGDHDLGGCSRRRALSGRGCDHRLGSQ